jgi:hypothetical protein
MTRISRRDTATTSPTQQVRSRGQPFGKQRYANRESFGSTTMAGVARRVLEGAMVKLVYVIRRRSDFTPHDFRRRWTEHGPLVREVAAAIRARRYVQSHTVDTPLNEALAGSRGMAAAYDGITEVWWDRIEDLAEALSTPEGRAAAQRLLDDEREFIDFAASNVFLSEEHEIFDLR